MFGTVQVSRSHSQSAFRGVDETLIRSGIRRQPLPIHSERREDKKFEREKRKVRFERKRGKTFSLS